MLWVPQQQSAPASSSWSSSSSSSSSAVTAEVEILPRGISQPLPKVSEVLILPKAKPKTLAVSPKSTPPKSKAPSSLLGDGRFRLRGPGPVVGKGASRRQIYNEVVSSDGEVGSVGCGVLYATDQDEHRRSGFLCVLGDAVGRGRNQSTREMAVPVSPILSHGALVS
jgi:hypothetical protein